MMSLISAVVLLCAVTFVHSDYIITTPRRWPRTGSVLPPQIAPVQVCASLFNNEVFDNAIDNWQIGVLSANDGETILQKTPLSLPQGSSMTCRDIETPHLDIGKATIQLEGEFGGKPFNEEVNVTVVNQVFRTFIQPDKALYKPGQKVQFRILTIDSTSGIVWTGQYDLIYVQTPKGVRIAQWIDVPNNGLVHLSLDLHREADKGQYQVYVNVYKKGKFSANFEVNEYVLPRYEVTLKAPRFITANDTKFDLELCAKYTFGQPVIGKAFLSVQTRARQWTFKNLTQSAPISGCATFTFPTKELKFDENNCHIRVSNVNAQGKVIEAGTNTELKANDQRFTIHRNVVNFKFINQDSGTRQRYLPVANTIAATYPDGSPAADERVEACTYYLRERICRNFKTDSNGQIQLSLPSSHTSNIEMRALDYSKVDRNYNNVMKKSGSNLRIRTRDRFTDIHDAYVAIYYKDKLNCVSGKNIQVNMPIIYVAKNQTSANIKIQTMSKLYVYDLHNEEIQLRNTELPFDKSIELLPVEKLPEGFVRGMVNVSFTLPANVAPRANFIVYFKTPDNAVVADENTLDVTPCLSHNVDFKWSVPKAEPGESVSYTIDALPKSICSVGAIDKSVELLRKRERITIQTILNAYSQMYGNRRDEKQLDFEYCLKKYANIREAQEIIKAIHKDIHLISRFRHQYVGRNDFEAINIFGNAGYHVFSNLDLEKKYCDEHFHKALKTITSRNLSRRQVIHTQAYLAPEHVQDDLGIVGNRVAFSPKTQTQNRIIGGNEKEEATIAEEPPRERVFFPETWLWDIVSTDETGTFTQELQVPDTITEWIGDAVCVKEGSKELGISEQSSIITFTPFFADLTLPAAVKRGEILPVIISTFNYEDSNLPMTLRIEPSPDFDFVKDNLIAKDGIIEDCIPPNESVVHRIKIIPKIIGHMNITVEAITNPQDTACSPKVPIKSDRLIKPILVKAEGFIRERNWNNYVCVQDLPSGEPVQWDIEVPVNIVNDSDRAWVNTIGDLVGPALNNINSLVKMPYGCGEQNLLTFTPNVFIMDYLNASGELTDDIKNRLISNLNSGYQRQLRFVRTDGSSSTFGNIDESGSTWLTAFVLRSFSHAKKYITIDQNVLNNSVKYLKNNVNKTTGCFKSTGRVVNKMLQGGQSTGKNPLLNAYIVVALIESGFGLTEEELISRAVLCFINDQSDHPYSLSLRAYALFLSGSLDTQGAIDKLLAASFENDREMWWRMPGRTKNKALEVETAAYALLTLLSYEYPDSYTTEARKIVRWLNSNRNSNGGFVSTQDTVVALQALTLYYELTPHDTIDLGISMKAGQLNEVKKINEDNKFLQQRVDLLTTKDPVIFIISGKGCTLLQGVLRYNVFGESGDEFFALTVTVDPLPKCSKNITICARYLLNDGASNMANIVVGMVTGYEPLEADLERIASSPPYKRYEVVNNDVTFYIDEITSNELCQWFTVEQKIEISNARPGTVRVYDYYQPELSAEKTYKIDACSQDAEV